jgi:hypothetical protein
MMTPACPGAGPSSHGEEALALRGEREDMGRTLVIAAPGLRLRPAVPLPKG